MTTRGLTSCLFLIVFCCSTTANAQSSYAPTDDPRLQDRQQLLNTSRNYREAMPSSYAATNEYHRPARELMRVARGMAAQGDAAGARSVAETARRMPTSWQGETTSPAQFIDSWANTKRQPVINQPGYPTVTKSSMQPVSPPSVTYPAPRTQKRVEICGYCQHDHNLSPIWVEADMYYWMVRDPDVAPLVTTSLAGTDEGDAGVLGLDSTTILMGNESLFHHERAGLRYAIGWQIQPHFSLTGSWMNIIRDTNGRDFGTGIGILARPFDNLDEGPDAELITFPGLTQGQLSVNADRDFDTLEFLFERDIGFFRNAFIKGGLGYRYARLDDDLSISEFSTAIGGPADGTVTRLVDEFTTENRFHGGTFGLSMHWHPTERWVVTFGGKVSVGNSTRRIQIDGGTITTDTAGDVSRNEGGLLAQPTNSGHFNDNHMTFFTEVGVKARCQIRNGVHFVMGYTFLHWDEVARASDQIDTTINTSQFPPGTLTGAANPAFRIVKNDFMAHGLKIGLEYAY